MTEKILLVDDEKDFLGIMSERMQTRGMKVSTAASAKEAIRMAEAESFDAIILDLQMPEMDGFQTLKNIRSNTDLGGIPIYAVTAKAMVGDKEIILKHNSPALIEIDGGVDLQNKTKLIEADADVLVAGNTVFGSKNPTETISLLKK